MPKGPDATVIEADALILARAVAGDEAAFASVVRAHGPALLRFAAAMLGSIGEAEDIVQEAFLRLWSTAPAWRPEARVSTWLHRVVRNLCLDRLRRRRPTVAIDDEMAETLASRDPPADEVIAAGVESDRLAAALARLPERQREAITLAHLQEMTQTEGAAIMEIGEEAYESLLARGRRRLRELLGPKDRDEATATAGGRK